jgi:hypothetical protein
MPITGLHWLDTLLLGMDVERDRTIQVVMVGQGEHGHLQLLGPANEGLGGAVPCGKEYAEWQCGCTKPKRAPLDRLAGSSISRPRRTRVNSYMM